MAFPLRSRTENAKWGQPLSDRHGLLLHAQRTTLFFCQRPSDRKMKPSLQIFQSTALASWWPVARLNRRLQARRTPPRGSSPLRHRHDRQHYTWRSGGQSGPVFAASMGCFELISRINADIETTVTYLRLRERRGVLRELIVCYSSCDYKDWARLFENWLAARVRAGLDNGT